jgi:anhydro-N-acetylmuramic acid kinase
MKPPKVHTAIGLMSGTSLDGVDAALIETDGLDYVKPIGFVTMPYQPKAREEIRACFGIKNRLDPKVKDAERLITFKHIEVIEELLRETGKRNSEIDVIGFHGQTIYHAPRDWITVQIGDGDLMARELRIDVVDDFRIADVKAGGEGAPLAPLYHAARVRHVGLEPPVAVLNIGGVANVTWIGENGDDIAAFDTGPGNAMMDDWTKQRIREPFDKDGALAAAGRANARLLDQWMNHEYFTRKPPKSLDRNEWDIAALGPFAQELSMLSDEDGAATLQEFTLRGILKSVDHMPRVPKHWYVCGGGRHNTALMQKLGAALADRGYGDLHSVDDLGWNGDATEAECFAYLAVRSLKGLPISLPSTTAAPEPMTGGKLHKKP